jgi:hypothetical protein
MKAAEYCTEENIPTGLIYKSPRDVSYGNASYFEDIPYNSLSASEMPPTHNRSFGVIIPRLPNTNSIISSKLVINTTLIIPIINNFTSSGLLI